MQATKASARVIIVNADHMGRGDEELGAKLLANFLRTLAAIDPKPDAIVFYNSAVKVLGPASASVESLKQLEDAGVDLLACITCLEFFALTEKIQVGHVSNMREIGQLLMAAEKVVTL